MIKEKQSTKMIQLLPPSYLRSNSYNPNLSDEMSSPDHQLIIHQRAKRGTISSFISSLLSVITCTIPSSFIINIPPYASCRRWFSANIIISSASSLLLSAFRPPAISSSKVTTVTLFGHRMGHAFLAIQANPRSEPLLILDLPISTSALVKEMSSGFVRIVLESCDRKDIIKTSYRNKALLEWTMYCNNRKWGKARSIECRDDFTKFVLDTVGSISVGAGVIPLVSHDANKCDYGPLMYMRARFEHVMAGNGGSEAFHLLNPDGPAGGWSELSIFLC